VRQLLFDSWRKLFKEKKIMSETKNAYIERQRENLKSWNVEIDKYQERASRTSDKMLDKLNKHIVELKEKRAGLEEKVSEMEKSLESGWEDLKIGAEKSFKELDKAFKAAKTHFN
jgi:predicted  nucleic acid-binding Zn-ribbon protein